MLISFLFHIYIYEEEKKYTFEKIIICNNFFFLEKERDHTEKNFNESKIDCSSIGFFFFYINNIHKVFSVYSLTNDCFLLPLLEKENFFFLYQRL
jgi:hypothetical protein